MLFTRIVKGLAMALAMVLAFSIFAGVAYGGLELLHAVGVIKSDPAEMRVAYEEASEGEKAGNGVVEAKIVNLEIELGAGSLELKEGEKLKVSTDIAEMTVEEKDGTLKVTEKSKWHLFSWQRGRTVTVEVPRDYKFEKVKIETGAGEVSIGEIAADEIKMETGAGKVLAKRITTKDLKLDLGAGEVDLRDVELEKADINCGVGKVSIELTGGELGYTFDLERGIGAIYLNGREMKKDALVGDGRKVVKIDGGIGEIDIKTGAYSRNTEEEK